MPKKTRRATALILIFLLLAANLMAELAHHHFTAGAEEAVTSRSWQIPSSLPATKSAQSLCLACLFASENQGIRSDVALLSELPSFPFVTPNTPSLFAQRLKISSHNRAPPRVEWI